MNIQEILEKYPGVFVSAEGSTDSYREDMPILERDPLAVIIKHPGENKYLLAKWKKAVWTGFLTGGIEDGDTLEDTVRKEILEETGYKNVGRILPMNFTSHALFFHVVKNVNRLAHYHLVVAKLIDLETAPVSEAEKAIAEFIWVPEEEVLESLTTPDFKALWNYYTKNK